MASRHGFRGPVFAVAEGQEAMNCDHTAHSCALRKFVRWEEFAALILRPVWPAAPRRPTMKLLAGQRMTRVAGTARGAVPCVPTPRHGRRAFRVVCEAAAPQAAPKAESAPAPVRQMKSHVLELWKGTGSAQALVPPFSASD
jgi:hypothetical protein